MKTTVALLSIAMALSGASCGGTSQPAGQAANSALPPDAGSGGYAALRQRGDVESSPPNRPASVVQTEGDAPPKDARFTLFCQVVHGPDHVLRASRMKDELIRTTGLRSWHIVHAEDQSSLFFGYYRSFDDKETDPQEFARAQGDLHRLNDLKDAQGERLFRTSMFVPVDEPNPEAPRQWDLANAPANAYWSLQIAAYRGSPERKQCAVDGVRYLRQHGVEAYYFHGESISSICVGAWPKGAIKRQDSDNASTADPDSIPLVVGDTLPPLAANELHNSEGKRVTPIAPKLEVLDPHLAQAIREFPDHSINGMTYAKKARNGELIKDPSFLVLVPHPDATQLPPAPELANPQNGSAIGSGADQAASAILEDSPRRQGYGTLNSIDRR